MKRVIFGLSMPVMASLFTGLSFNMWLFKPKIALSVISVLAIMVGLYFSNHYLMENMPNMMNNGEEYFEMIDNIFEKTRTYADQFEIMGINGFSHLLNGFISHIREASIV